jgi:predicted NUDIX family NTP pyrophosphohydrolase
MKQSAGLVLYRLRRGLVEVLLVHPGGPFWQRKDEGAWSVPKGEAEPDEDLLGRARQELTEETGCIAEGEFRPLAPVRQAGGKMVYAWAVEGDCDVSAIKSNTFHLEWPPRSGKMREFPEVDRAEWFDLTTARRKINKAQRSFLDELERVC